MRAKPWWDRRITARARQLLGLPAPRQPLARRDRGARRARARQIGARRRPRAPRMGAEGGLGQRRAALELQPRPRRWCAARRCSTPARAACSASARGRCSTRRNGEWLERVVTGDVRHLLLADTLPIFLPQAIHNLESWNDAVSAGAWTRASSRASASGCAARSTWSTGPPSRLVPPHRRADPRSRRGRARRAAGVHRHARRRHPPRLPGEGRVSRRRPAAEPRLAGGLLALPQRAQQARTADRPGG